MELIRRRICKEPLTSRKQANWGQVEGDAISINFCLTSSYEDLGVMSLTGEEEWVPGRKYEDGDYFIQDGIVYGVNGGPYKGDYNEEIEEIEFNPESGSLKVSEGENFGTSTTFQRVYTTSKLMGLRRTKRPLNEDGTEAVPNSSNDEDWMILYVPDLVVNVSGETEVYIEDKQRKSRLINATGDMVLGAPVVDSAAHTLTYTYLIGVHLADETLEPDTSTGIKYTDVYTFDPDVFQEVTDYDNVSMDNLGVFKTIFSKTFTVKKVGDSSITDARVSSQMEFTDGTSFYHRTPFRKEEMLGVTFKPSVSADISVDRGINAAFERHIKLGEVKTLDDLVNYANGGFFNIKVDEQETGE